MRYSVSILHDSQPGLFDTPGFPECVQYTPKEKGAQGPLCLSGRTGGTESSQWIRPAE
jgi:hypothetical protein